MHCSSTARSKSRAGPVQPSSLPRLWTSSLAFLHFLLVSSLYNNRNTPLQPARRTLLDSKGGPCTTSLATASPAEPAMAEQLGPAWTRETKKNKSKRPTTSNTQQPFYSATGSNSASSSSLVHLPPTAQPSPSTASAAAQAPPVQEAPYLTHLVRNPLGQLTLVPPDNLGRQRQPGQGDAPMTDEQPPPAKVKKKKKKRQKDPAIMDAVINAGRSPGTPPLAQAQVQPGEPSRSRERGPSSMAEGSRSMQRSRSANSSLLAEGAEESASATSAPTARNAASSSPLGELFPFLICSPSS